MKTQINLKSWMALFILPIGLVVADVITVDDDGPADYTTIQAAVNAAVDTDVIIIQPGMYTGTGNRDIDFLGKAITVRSTDPQDPNIVSDTVIDSQGTSSDWHRAFRFHTNEGPDSIIDGLTLIGGYTEYGGAINCEMGTGPTIRNCIIRGNTAIWEGGGIDCTTSEAVIVNCLIEDNVSGYYAGGINCCESSDLTIIGCTIRNNTAANDGGGIQFCVSSGQVINCSITNNVGYEGGGIWVRGPVHISNCTIVNNTATRSDPRGGALALDHDDATVTNCILWDNFPNEVYTWEHTPSVSYTDIKGGWSGAGGNNIDIDPNFVDPIAGDYRLASGSPCIDVGDNGAVTEPNDIEGLPRIVDGDCDGTATVDMGAHEFDWLYVGDFEGGCDVDLADFAVMAQSWQLNNPAIDIAPYLDPDGIIDLGE
ncbi:MAG: choice-of-anchor Q domain-containing protein, partial [Planctomycetota bacterium]